MRKKVLIILVLLLTISWTGCNRNVPPPVKEIFIKENHEKANLAILKKKEIAFSDINYPHLRVGTGKVWVYGLALKDESGNANRYIIKEYDHQLNFLKEKYLNYGQGPGDIGGGSYMHLNKDKVIFYDNILRRISIFDQDFSFIKFIKTNRYLPITFIDDGKAFMAIKWRYDEEKRKFHFYDIDYVTYPGIKRRKIMTFGPWATHTDSKKYFFGNFPGFHFLYRQGLLYFLNMKTYQIHQMDLEGNIKTRINVEYKELETPESMKKAWLREQIGRSMVPRSIMADKIQPTSWMVPLEKGFVVIRRFHYSTDCKGPCEGDYFDWDLNLKGKVEFPCFYRIFKLRYGYFPFYCEYKDGSLFLVNEYDEEFKLEKWSVKE